MADDDEQTTSPGEPRDGAPRVTVPPRPFDVEDRSPPPDASVESGTGDTGDEAEARDEELQLVPQADPAEPEPFEDLAELPALLEALLFVADHPVDANYLARAVEVSVARVEHALDALAESLRDARRGVRLQRGPAGVQLVSAPEAAARVEHFLGLEANRRLSTAALETLAIIAYRQPVTRGQVDAIRGVSSDGAITTLRARELIEPAGHAPGPGRPTLFRTTQRFLEHFGLERPGQLPPLPEDIDLPPSEIGEQLGLDDAAIAEALRPADPPPEPVEDLVLDEPDAPDEVDEVVASVLGVADVEITSDVRALTDAAGHAFEASRERQVGDEDDRDSDEEDAEGRGG